MVRKLSKNHLNSGRGVSGNSRNKAKFLTKSTFLFIVILVLLVALIFVSISNFSNDSKNVFSSSQTNGKNKVFSGSGANFESYSILSGDEPLTLKRFHSEDDLMSVFSSSTNYDYYGGLRGPLLKGAVMMDSQPLEVAPATNVVEASTVQESNIDYSKTNNYVSGVDEADIIKTDGSFIYTISGKTLFLIKAYPGEEASVVSKIIFNSTPQNLFVDGDSLIVFGRESSSDYKSFYQHSSMLFFRIYDISDKKSPILSKEFHIEGSYLDSRLFKDSIYLVVRNTPVFSRPIPLPVVYGGLPVKENARVLPVEDIYYTGLPLSNPQLLTVYKIDVAKKKIVDQKAITVDGNPVLYMSRNNIFIVSSQYISEWVVRKELMKKLLNPKLSLDELDRIDRIMGVDVDILSPSEKNSKIIGVYYSHLDSLSESDRNDFNDLLDKSVRDYFKKIKYLDYSVITKISFDGSLEVVASNRVPGRIINQFSINEFDSNLRIATNIPRRWVSVSKSQSISKNAVFVLDSNLNILGRLQDIAEDEQIYSTRFVGDRLYMVTYRNVDPFFVIGLSNPKKPVILGELKLPGFSRYLHPYDDTHIIGLGKETSSSGASSGLKIAIFDVGDVKHPVLNAKYVTSEKYASSNALFEHKAFLFSKDKSLLVIPAYNGNYRWDSHTEHVYNGAFVFNINETNIDLRGLIDHSFSQKNNFYGPLVERSLYIEDELFTKSKGLLRINSLSDLHSIKNITLVSSNHPIPVY